MELFLKKFDKDKHNPSGRHRREKIFHISSCSFVGHFQLDLFRLNKIHSPLKKFLVQLSKDR